MLSFHLPPFSENTFLPEVFQKQNDCAFLWFLPDVDSFCINMDDYKDVQNVMPIFKMEALMESEIHQILSAHKKLYGVYQLYNEQNIRECISRKSLGLLSSLGTPFLFFIRRQKKRHQQCRFQICRGYPHEAGHIRF